MMTAIQEQAIQLIQQLPDEKIQAIKPHSIKAADCLEKEKCFCSFGSAGFAASQRF